MTQVSGLDNAGLFTPPPSPKARDELGQQDFLTLMITQFRNQDPFEPMDNGDFLGQLAQFGTVNGIEQLNSAFAGLSSSIQSEQVLQAANLVGRSVLASSDTGYLGTDGTLSGAVELPASAGNVQIEISDASGQLVRRLELGAHEAGLATFTWDGRDASQEPVAPGHYRVTAQVVRGTEVESAETLLNATIESVNLGQFGQGMTLNLPGGETLSVDQVRRIL
ncbi:MAG: flagellar hook assembly protein FlgD [Woeseiaceae bacterium]